MVNSVTIPPNTISTQPKKNVSVSIFNINDIHGQVPNMERIQSAGNAFDSFTPSDTIKLKFSSGDTLLGEDLNLNLAATKFLNTMGITATAIGNHEFDISPQNLVDFTKDAKYKLLGLNSNINDSNVLKNKIAQSYIEEKNGEKFGVIGLMPFDMFTRLKYKERFDGITIDKLDQTVKELQEEVNKLKEQGINKIILLSHVGNANDIKIAQQVEGIDVILGGHSHDLIEGIKEGENLFYSKKTGEPTIITQAGKDGRYFGILNLEFDDKGVVKTAQNNVMETKNFPKNKPLQYLFDSLLGKSQKVGTISYSAPQPNNPYTEENPHANFLADAMRVELGTDIAFLNSANLRGNFEAGDITDRDIASVTPFKNKMTRMKLNEKELVDALKWGATSLTRPDSKPGILQVSGLKYKINKAGELLEAKFINKNGQEETIDIKNPNTFKIYALAIDDYYAKGADKFSMLNKIDQAEIFDYDKDKLAIDYIKHLNKPVEIKTDGRIQVVD